MRATPINASEFSGMFLLHCPRCGEDYLHQGRVDVFMRDYEDSQTGTHVTVSGSSGAMDQDLTGNPSPRGQGLRIALECESCGPIGYLNIYQHKGCTYLTTSED